jgi:hypothetical protein
VSRTILNFLLDSSLLIVFSALCFSSVITRFIFPPAVDAKGWLLWGLSYDQWASVQFGTVAVLALGVLIHVMLHWSWICGVVQTRMSRDKKAKLDSGTQTLYGVALLIVLLNVVGFAIAAAGISIRAPL